MRKLILFIPLFVSCARPPALPQYHDTTSTKPSESIHLVAYAKKPEVNDLKELSAKIDRLESLILSSEKSKALEKSQYLETKACNKKCEENYPWPSDKREMPEIEYERASRNAMRCYDSCEKNAPYNYVGC